MSLVYFHIFLIFTGVLFSFFLGFWELGNFSNTRQIFDLVTGILSFIFSVVLICYLVWFIKKKKPLMK